MRSGTTNAAQRLNAFLKLSENGAWSAADIRIWTAVIKTSEIAKMRNAKAFIEDLQDNDTDLDGNPALTTDVLFELFPDETLDAAYAGDLDWYEKHLTSQAKKPAEFPVEVARSWGPQALSTRPSVVIGTCHSVKGGEADVVYLFPDLSRSSHQEWQRGYGDNAGAVYRLFYVGMTRARETLVICSPYDNGEPEI